MRPTAVTTVDAAEGLILSVVGDTYRVVVSGEQTGGAFATIDMMIPPNGGPGPHAHTAIQESFFVIDGEIMVRSEIQKYTAKKGAFVSIPMGGAIHSFKNESDAVAHLLCVVMPSGLENFSPKWASPWRPEPFCPRRQWNQKP